jgi:hypothetical protein
MPHLRRAGGPEKRRSGVKIKMKNPRTGEVREIKVGWSWQLFLLSGLFGLPLFLRKLNVWGGIFLALWVVNLIGPGLAGPGDATGLGILLLFVFLGLQIWLGVKGNEMTAKNYLELGWTFVDQDAEGLAFAKGKWGIA